MAETSDSSTSSSTTTAVQEDDGRTPYARLVGALLLIAPLLLVYPLIALWPRAQGSPPTLCDWQREKGSATGTGQAEKTQTASAQAQEEPPASGVATPGSTPPGTDATTSTAQPAGSAETPGTGAAAGATGAPATPTAAEVARELKRIQDEEKKEQWVPCAKIRPFTEEFPLAPDVRLLLLVLLAGALGAYVHAAQSYTSYIGNRKFMKQWTWWYLLRIPVGAALALFVYFTARGGLLTGTTPPSKTDDLNIFGIMALAVLSGLFSKQAIDKLAEVFSNLFKSDQDAQREDKMDRQGAAAQNAATTTTAQGGGAGGATTTTTTTTQAGGTGGTAGATGGAAG